MKRLSEKLLENSVLLDPTKEFNMSITMTRLQIAESVSDITEENIEPTDPRLTDFFCDQFIRARIDFLTETSDNNVKKTFASFLSGLFVKSGFYPGDNIKPNEIPDKEESIAYK